MAPSYNSLVMSIIQKFITVVLPKSWVAKLERDSRDWKVRCNCGHSNSLWDLGGIRGTAAGKTHWRRKCEKCGLKSWQDVVYEPDI